MAYIFSDMDLANVANNLLGLVPFANLGCTGVFKPRSFQIYKDNESTPILSGTRDDPDSLWRVPLSRDAGHTSDAIPPPTHDAGVYIEANAVSIQYNATYVRFVHAGFITGPDQYPRLTTKMVRKHLPNAMATAKGHLDRTPSGLPHAALDAIISARKRHHKMATRDSILQLVKEKGLQGTTPFSPKDSPRSTTLHLDYTGPLPDVCCSGTRYFQVRCWGGYINIQPLTSLRHEHTTMALKSTVEFFRQHGAEIEEIRMDN
jgi:hypothetical protein